MNAVTGKITSTIESAGSSLSVQRLQLRFNSLRQRDKLALKILAVFLAIALLYVLLLRPMYQFAEANKQRYVAGKSTLVWMDENRNAFASFSSQNSAARAGRSLLSLASEEAQALGFSLKRFEPVGEGGLRLWLDAVAFNQILLWVSALDRNYKIAVQEIRIDRNQNGSVHAALVLTE